MVQTVLPETPERPFFVIVYGISPKAPCDASAMHGRHRCKGAYDSVLLAFVKIIRALMVTASPKSPDGAGISL